MSASSTVLQQLMAARVHLGHRTSVWNPKMKPYILGERNGIHILDLEQTVACLRRALLAFRAAGEQGLAQLWLAPKDPLLQEMVSRRAEEVGAFTLPGRWIGGTLTNAVESRQIRRFGGRLPDLLFCLDVHRHATALREARLVNIPTVAVIDSDCDPEQVTYPIPGNDESALALNLYCSLAAQATREGLQRYRAAHTLHATEASS
ncbi:hypothetical protein CDCA_CDCA02G0539 [Cyanidium caldarium]|uniref:30S ribosomal protein S2 n=1 Tax=Cyanidium caldarium TaxID=2771 RepID=A0AAV9IQU4_CYACA|nr:hypothetical protein CDCA_CDCA02G0539 [Cyanidium caldarium]